MRSGPNSRRLRGRGSNNNRRGNTPRNQNFESNGPEVKVRGNAQQVVEKYLQLARDAATAGESVMAENYYQHAEHYYRLQNAQADRAQRQQQDQNPDQQRGGNDDMDDDDYNDVQTPSGERSSRNGNANADAQPNARTNANGAEDGDEAEPQTPPETQPQPRPSRSQRSKSAPAAAVEAAIEASREPTGEQPG